MIWNKASFKEAWIWGKVGLVLILASFVLGLVLSEKTGKSLKGFSDALRAFASYFAGFCVISRYRHDRPMVNLNTVSAFFMVVLIAIYIILAIVANDLFLRQNTHVYEWFGNLHEYANIVTICLIVRLAIFRTGDLDAPSIIGMTALAIILIYSDSTGNWLAFSFASTLLVALKCRPLIITWLACLAITISILIYTLYFSTEPCASNICSSESSLKRMELYGETILLIREHPWFGHGLATFKHLNKIELFGGYALMPHSIYLEVFFSMGLIGGTMFFLGLVIAATKGIRTVKSSGAIIYKISLALFVYLLLRGLVDFKWLSIEYLGYLLFLLGCIAGISHNDMKHPLKSSQLPD
jgi:O-antigen ligase